MLLERVRRTWAEARALGGAHHEPFTVAVGALAVYARACGVPVTEVVRAVHAVLADDEASSPAWRELVRETAVRNYDRVD